MNISRAAPPPSRRAAAGRNAPCPCGSGRKSKQCCGRAADQGAAAGDDFAAETNRGVTHLRAHHLPEAIACFERAVALRPATALAHYNLGFALEQLGRDDAAIAAFRRAVEHDPRHLDAWERLGNQYLARANAAEAIAAFRRAGAAGPHTTIGLMCQARIALHEGRPEQAERALRRAIARDPANSSAHRMLGTVLGEAGRFAEGTAMLERAIELAPDHPTAYYDLTNVRRIGPADAKLVSRMEALLAATAPGGTPRVSLHYALGKAFDDLGEHARAIRQFDQGNAILHRQIGRDRAGFAANVNRVIECFDADFFARHGAHGAADETPVLILGMPRSGTTLVEQIVSAHPAVAGAGELAFWNDHAKLYGAAGADSNTPALLGRIAAAYRAELRRHGPHAARVTDKMPFNFLWMGLVHLIFPRARFIHCRRHPVDTCLSNYFTNFAVAKEYCHDRGDLVFYYRAYERLMAHWRAVLPADRLLEIDYEAVVADREAQTRRMIAFCGLAWDDACLRPEGNERIVTTASVWQARQPVYRRSVERWRNYEPWLGALRQLLPDYPAPAPVVHPRSGNPALPRIRALAAAGKPQEALTLTVAELRRLPDDEVLYNELGVLHLRAGRLPAALDSFERASALNAAFAFARHGRAVTLERLGQRPAALAALRAAIACDPALVEAHALLGNLLLAEGDRPAAAESFRRAAELAPDQPRGLLERAKTLAIEEQFGDAELALRRAIALDPAASEAHGLLGSILNASGRFAEAAAALRRAVELDPDHIHAWHDLVHAGRLGSDAAALVGRMEAVLADPRRTDFERTLLHFALGKAHDDRGDPAAAMPHFDAGNAIEHRAQRLDRAALAANIDHIIAMHPADPSTLAGSADATPVLVVGMPRSGTTLVEQILSSHPAAAGAGEVMFWTGRAAEIGHGAAGQPVLARFAEDYLALLRRTAPDARRIIDKMPFNFLALGLIRRALPWARIIHIRRHPVDTCLSIYTLRFAQPMEFAYDRGDLVFYYRQYARLMAQWRRALPAARFLEIDYETLIAERETTTRRMVGFCGLDWDDACLRPQDNARLVRTASLWQARQPVYATSVARWRRYKPWLGELAELLSPEEAAARLAAGPA